MFESYNKDDILKQLLGGVIISCQARDGEPLFGGDYMLRMAQSAHLGGAVGIRAKGVQDVRMIVEQVPIPVLGIIKHNYEDAPEVYITPTMTEVDALVEGANPHIIAVDGTLQEHPETGWLGPEYIRVIKQKYPSLMIMADISTLDEGIAAEEAGADLVATTLSGYTSYSAQVLGPDYELIENLSKVLKTPVIAEGRIWERGEAKRAFDLGAFAIVIGSSVTRPHEITKRFVAHTRG